MTSQIDRIPGPQLRRREVLAGGAGLVTLPALGWATRGRCGGLAIGFCRDDQTEDTVTPMVAASRLAAGDPRLARGDGARVTVHGLTGNTNRLPSLGIRSAELRIGFPAIAGTADRGDLSSIEFRAWCYQLLPVEQFGPPVSFTVPVDRGLALALEIEALGNERFETMLVTGRETGQPKLRAGRYLIAPGAREFRPRRFEPTRSEPMIALSVEPVA